MQRHRKNSYAQSEAGSWRLDSCWELHELSLPALDFLWTGPLHPNTLSLISVLHQSPAIWLTEVPFFNLKIIIVTTTTTIIITQTQGTKEDWFPYTWRWGICDGLSNWVPDTHTEDMVCALDSRFHTGSFLIFVRNWGTDVSSVSIKTK